MATLTGRRVLVTGATGALGSATATALRERGARVAGLDLRPDDGVIACNIRDARSVDQAVAAARAELDGLDAVVHFAGIGVPTSAGEPADDEVMRTLDVNLLGPWRVTAACIDDLVQSRGRCVFVASELAYATLPFAAAYCAAKRGLAAYADSVRVEYGSHVGVTTVYPGFVRTPIHDASVAAGLGLEGFAVRSEQVGDVVTTVVRALSAARPPRDTACTPMGRVELAAARHLPALVDTVIRTRLRRSLAEGRFITAPLAAGMRTRLGVSGPLEAVPADDVVEVAG